MADFLFDPEKLARWMAEAFVAAGVTEQDALDAARVLTRTSLRGVDTHGVARVLPYMERLRSGDITAVPRRRLETQDNLLLIDGDNGLGQPVAMDAVRASIARAADVPVVTCLIRRARHLGALGHYVLEVAEHNMVAVMCQETPPLMAMGGARRPAIGNNPIAFAAPLAGRAPLVFDMATSVVSRGSVRAAIRDKAASIPDGWAIGPDGEPTTDPAAAWKGSMLPIAGHKGIGLAMMVQVLAGCLAAGDEPSAVNDPTSSAFLLVINPDRLFGRSAFERHMSDWITEYGDASGGSGSRYPGERAANSEARRRAHGIPLPSNMVDELRKAGGMVGRPFDLEGTEIS